MAIKLTARDEAAGHVVLELQSERLAQYHFRDQLHKQQRAQLAVAVAIYIAIIAGFALYSLMMPDKGPPPSVTPDPFGIPYRDRVCC